MQYIKGYMIQDVGGYVMICTKCGKKINFGVQFCNFCGEQTVDKIPCPSCGKLIPNNTKFCNYCGNNFSVQNMVADIPELKAPTMKKHILKCESCGSLSVIKQDDIFVCQSCGSSYTFESAQHITIQNTINISESKKINKDSEYDNYKQAGDDAFNDGLYTNAASYYSKALAINPNSPLLIVRHGLSVFAKERISSQIPLTAINCIDRAIERLKKLDCSEEEFFDTIISCYKDIDNICNLYVKFLEKEISNVKSNIQKIRSEGAAKKNGLSKTDINRIKNLNEKIKDAQSGINLVIQYRNVNSDKIINTLTCLSDECLIAYIIYYIEQRNTSLVNMILDKKIKKNPNTPVGWFSKALLGLWQDKIDYKQICSNVNNMIFAYKKNPSEYDNNVNFINKYINSTDTKGNSLIHISVQECDYAVTDYLIFLGIDINRLNKNKETALWYSASKKWRGKELTSQINIAKILLDNGASIDVKNKYNIALYNKKTDEQIESLILNYYPNASKGKSNILF